LIRFIKKNKFQIFKFVIVGIASTLINFGIYSLIYYFTLRLNLASILGYASGIINSFYFSDKWVFNKSRNKNFNFALILFIIIYVVGAFEMTVVINLINYSSNNHQFAWLCGVLVAASNNYLCSKYFLFNN
tara:strand:+ start:1859 stop:2251 length:393 start_codon:yes stop_codon:yes gene_type:complete